jgi:hypothetical protein
MRYGASRNSEIMNSLQSSLFCVFAFSLIFQITLRNLYIGIDLVPDDLMNLWIHCLRSSWGHELGNLFRIAEPLDRSAAVLFYRPIFEAFGLRAEPYLLVHDVLVVLANGFFSGGGGGYAVNSGGIGGFRFSACSADADGYLLAMPHDLRRAFFAVRLAGGDCFS